MLAATIVSEIEVWKLQSTWWNIDSRKNGCKPVSSKGIALKAIQNILSEVKNGLIINVGVQSFDKDGAVRFEFRSDKIRLSVLSRLVELTNIFIDNRIKLLSSK